MKMTQFLSLVACAAALLTGCGTTVHYSPTNTPPRPLSVRTAESVHVFTTGGPARPYTEVGLIQVQEDLSGSADMPEILADMRAEAAERGCDGLVITGRADEAEGSVFGNQQFVYGTSGTREGLMGACIVYVDPPSADEPAAVVPPAG